MRKSLNSAYVLNQYEAMRREALGWDAYGPRGHGLVFIARYGFMELYPVPMTMPVACSDSLADCHTPPEQLQKLLEAGRKYKALPALGPDPNRQIAAGHHGERIQCDPV